MPRQVNSSDPTKSGPRYSRAKEGRAYHSRMVYEMVKGGSRANAVVEFDRLIVSFFVEAAELMGVPRSVAAIYAICFASPEPLSFSEIDERLDISKGSISQGLRILRNSGALKAHTSSVDRCDRFVPDLELRNLVLRFLDHRLEKQLEAGGMMLQEISSAVPTDNHAASQILLSRVGSLQTWHAKGRALLPLMKGFLRMS